MKIGLKIPPWSSFKGPDRLKYSTQFIDFDSINPVRRYQSQTIIDINVILSHDQLIHSLFHQVTAASQGAIRLLL